MSIRDWLKRGSGKRKDVEKRAPYDMDSESVDDPPRPSPTPGPSGVNMRETKSLATGKGTKGIRKKVTDSELEKVDDPTPDLSGSTSKSASHLNVDICEGEVSDDRSSSTDEEVSGEKSGEMKSRSSKSTQEPKTKRKKYSQGFRYEWLQDKKFKSWLQSPSQGSTKPMCSFCSTFVPCAKSGLERHARSAMHLRNACTASAQLPIKDIIESSVKKSNYSITTVSRICAFVAEHNLPFSISQPLVQLIKSSCPTNSGENEQLKNLKMSRTKCGNIMRQGLGYYFSKDLVDKLRETKFSIIPDETTDITTDKQLAICVMYYDYIKLDVVTSFFDMINVQKCDAQSLYDAIKVSFKEKNIPLQNIIGYASDTCNVMFGEHRSVTSLMKLDLPYVICVRCSCHLIHLCVYHACLKLSTSLEDLCRNIYAYFSRSSLRRHELEEFQNFVNVAPHKLLSYGQTRWLSLETCVKRVLEQWDALRLYFTAVVSEKRDPSYVTDSIYKSLDNNFIKAQLEFIEVQLKRTNEFNKMFQSEKPVLHILDSEIKKLLRDTMSDYMFLQHVKDCNPFTIDFHDQSMRVPTNDVYVGINATETLSNPPICNDKEGIRIFKENCLSFLVELTSQIRSRFLTSPLSFLEFLNPRNSLNRQPNSLVEVFKAMPFLDDMCDKEKADIEWRQLGLEGHFEEVKDTIEFWQKSLSQTNINDEKKYPNLSIVVGCALSLPHSNASVERIFSHLRRIKTDLRSSLKDQSLVSLLHTKNGLKRLGISSDQLELDANLLKELTNVKSNATNEECSKILMQKFK